VLGVTCVCVVDDESGFAVAVCRSLSIDVLSLLSTPKPLKSITCCTVLLVLLLLLLLLILILLSVLL
jgi:hypothetical protein